MIRAMLKIRPLAPLSLVSASPGSFYRSSSKPSDEMVYGMLENIMGWHFSKEIRRDCSKVIKKRAKKDKSEWVDAKSLSGYEPVIQNYVQIKKLFVQPYTSSYIDLWTQHLKHNDKRHFDGVRNYDHRFTREINMASDSDKETILKSNIGHFPKYYQSPKKREFITVQGEYIYEVNIKEDFVNHLIDKIEDPFSVPYLGTSEGWVDVVLVMIEDK
ncbi:type I-PGING CRISPR-associated protein Cas5p [Echinicola sp. 20G]|uniref:type I-PGING CRISPR-associated protein Cas5p n=1 Tax=Echinicola sp. 20G TaxID=2781961 RepID=UPI00191124EB|nr:type I-PGING CRISPR-associated protein Cas5p [Echinicola sp. 20G]